MSMLDAALKLVSQGFYVFPCHPDGKTPIYKGWQNQATNKPEEVRKLWTDFAGRECDYNIGIFTSRFGDNEALVAIDVDNKGEKKGDEQLLKLELEGKELPPTFEQITPTGGRHLLYRVKEPVGNGVNKIAPGIDTRSKGGYVLGAGSKINGAVYTAIQRALLPPPDWVLSLCGRKTQEKQNVLHLEMFDQARAVSRAIHYLEHEAPVSVQGAGGDHTAFVVAAKLKDLGVPRIDAVPLLMGHWNERCQPPWSPEELDVKVSNGYQYSSNPFGTDALEAQFSKVTDTKPSNDKMLPVKHYADIRPSVYRKPLVQNLLNPSDVALAFAESNNGKSWFAIELAHAIATGQPFLGRKTVQAPVLYIVAEGAEGFKRRIAAYQKQKGYNPQEVPFFMIEEQVNFLTAQGEDVKALVASMKHIEEKSGPIGLLIIDTLSRVMGAGDENKSEDMNLFNNRITRIAKETGAHVLIIHHQGKDSTKGARGHSSLRAAVDTEIRVEKKADLTFVATVTKQRDMEFCEPLAFKLEKVVIGKDPEGDLIESCVVVPAALPIKDHHLSPVAELALDALLELSGIFEETAVPIADWRDAFNKRYQADNKKAKGMAWSRAKTELVLKNRVSLDDEHATLIGGGK